MRSDAHWIPKLDVYTITKIMKITMLNKQIKTKTQNLIISNL